jgi:DNA-binding NtrC family response regulator
MRPDGLWVRDLGSLNGTYLEGVRVAHARLDVNLQLRVGSTVATVSYDRRKANIELWPLDRFGPLVGRSVAMRELFALLAKAAESNATVLIQGETGTGKELVAKSIHEASRRVNAPFAVVDCGAISASLIEAELFGHARGAFTGAHADRAGAVEFANGGTVFLDEVGELPLSLQPKLLRLIESRTVCRIGETQHRAADVRFIAATNRDLGTMVNEGTFREDLYFRLAVLQFRVPSLRERIEDIPLLLEHFLPREVPIPAVELIAELNKRPWHGNVRELRNFVERAIVLGTDNALQGGAGNTVASTVPALPSIPLDRPFKELRDAWVSQLEHDYLKGLLQLHSGNVSAVAQASGFNRTYLYKLLRKHGL